MKPKYNSRPSTVAAIVLAVSFQAQAQLTWDPSSDSGIQIEAGTWDDATSNWTSDGGSTNTTWTNDTAAVFNGDLAEQTDVTLSGAISANGISRVGTGAGMLRLVASTGNTLAVSGEVNVETRLQLTGGDAGAFSGTFTKTGTGLLLLDGLNSRFDFGTVTLSAGSIALFNGSALQSETLILNGGAIGSWNTTARSIDGNVTIGGDIGMGSGTGPELLGGTLNFGSTGTVDLGGATRILTIGSVVALNGVVSNGGITKEGGARLDFSNIANIFSGPITVNSGELRALTGIDQTGALSTLGTGAVTVNSGAQLTLSTAAATTNSKSYGNAITLDSATLRANGGVTTLSGPISLSGANTIQSVSGTTLIIQENIVGTGSFTKAESGTLQIGNGGTTGTLGSGAVTISAGTLTISRSDDHTLSNDISGTGTFRVEGSGTTTLTGNNTLAGNNRVLGGGVLSVTTVADGGGIGALGTGAGDLRVAGNSTLRITGTGTQTTNRTIWNNSSTEDGPATFEVVDANASVVFTGTSGNINRPLTKAGAGSLTLNQTIFSNAGNTVTVNGGTLQLNNNNFYAGGTSVNAGTLIIGNGGSSGTIGSGFVTIGEDGTVRINRGDSYTIGNAISGDGGFIQQGSGTSVLTGNITYTGPTVIQDGVVEVSNAGIQTLSGVISGPGALVKSGAGTLILEAQNTYTGDTTIVAGTLSLDEPALADESAVRITTGATLDLFHGEDDTVARLFIDDVQQAAGTYNSGNSSFVTSGNLIVTEDPVAAPYAAWIDGFFTGITDPLIVGPNADPDGDGVPNLVEFLTGGIPNDNGDKGLLWVGVSGNQLVLSLAIRGETTTFTGSPSPSASVDGTTVSIQGSLDLAGFTSPVSGIPFVLPSGWSATAPSGLSYHSFRLDGSVGLPDKGFLRLNATQP
jgi:autotransporter-associated beta strand protein